MRRVLGAVSCYFAVAGIAVPIAAATRFRGGSCASPVITLPLYYMLVAEPPPPPPIESWADPLHGWEVRGSGVSATDDGGQTGHVIFRDGQANGIRFVLRSSATAGVFVDGAALATFVTSDAGRHWYIDATGIGTDALASGSAFFWARYGGIVRVLDWPPPRSSLRCHGHWYHQVGGPPDVLGPKPRNICLGGPGVALRTKVVWSVPPSSRWAVTGEALVPGGIVASAFDEDTSAFTALIIYRNGHATVTDSFPPLPTSGDTLPKGRLRVYAAWPQLLLIAANGVWTSPDGGRTWSASPSDPSA